MEAQVYAELASRGFLDEPPQLSYDGCRVRLKLKARLSGEWVEGSREIAGAKKGECAVRADKDPRNWCRSNFRLTTCPPGKASSTPRDRSATDLRPAPKTRHLAPRGIRIEDELVFLPVRGSASEVVCDLSDFLAAGFDPERPPQCLLQTKRSGRQTVMVSDGSGLNPTTLKARLANDAHGEVWLKDRDQHNLRSANWDVRPRKKKGSRPSSVPAA